MVNKKKRNLHREMAFFKITPVISASQRGNFPSLAPRKQSKPEVIRESHTLL